MSVQTQMLQFLNEVWTSIEGSLLNAMTKPTIHLYTNNPTIQPTMTSADFTEAIFAGYAAVLFQGFLPPAAIGNTRLVAYNTMVATFQASAPTAGQTVNGYYITDKANKLVAAEKFDTPVPMSNTGDQINLLCGIGIGPSNTPVVIVP